MTEKIKKTKTVEKQLDSSDSMPKKEHKYRLSKLLTWFVLVAVLVGGSAVLYDNLVYQDSFLEIGEDDFDDFPSISSNNPIQENSVTVPTLQSQDVDIDSAQKDNHDVSSPIAEVQEQASLPVDETNPEQQNIQNQQTEIIKPDYSLIQALALRDAVYTNKDCREQIEILIHVKHKTPLMEQVITSLLPQCLDNEQIKDDKAIFKAHKKQAILSIFRQKYSSYIAYFRALPWLLMDIHQIQPTGSDPIDILDKLQNAVYANNYEDAMSALESLPPVTAAIFNDLRQQLYAKQERIKLLDELVLSFAKGE